MGAQGMTSILPVRNPKDNKNDSGKLIVRCEKMEDSNCTFLMTQSFFRCDGMPTSFTTPIPFLTFGTKAIPIWNFWKSEMITPSSKYNGRKPFKTIWILPGSLSKCQRLGSSIPIRATLSKYLLMQNWDLGLGVRRQRSIHRISFCEPKGSSTRIKVSVDKP